MSNNENKNEQFKNLKEIEGFVKDVSRPFLAFLAKKKSLKNYFLGMCAAIKQ